MGSGGGSARSSGAFWRKGLEGGGFGSWGGFPAFQIKVKSAFLSRVQRNIFRRNRNILTLQESAP